MAWDTDFVEQDMKLTDDGRHLRGEIARVHGWQTHGLRDSRLRSRLEALADSQPNGGCTYLGEECML